MLHHIHLGAKGKGPRKKQSKLGQGEKGSKEISLAWPQEPAAEELGKGKKQVPLWEGSHAESGNRLHIGTKKDRHLLMVLYEDGKHSLCNRIDVCGATPDRRKGRKGKDPMVHAVQKAQDKIQLCYTCVVQRNFTTCCCKCFAHSPA